MIDPQPSAELQAPAQLVDAGWNDAVAAAFARIAEPGDIPARVIAVHRSRIAVATERGELTATLDVSLLEGDPVDRPATGDWIALCLDGPTAAPRARCVVPRRTAFIRRAAGQRPVAQVVAANIDDVLIVTALPNDVNVRRLERYLALAWESGAMPAVVLTKCDLLADASEHLAALRATAPGVDVVAVSATNTEGIDALHARLAPATTIALLGSSGVGKSTLVNRLAGFELMQTASIANDGRGRHTTTHRQLVRLPSGVLVIDTPGMRELQLWSADAGLAHTFEDITALSESCRFADCRHEREPGCAVSEAVATGTLDAARVKSWRKLTREAARAQKESDVVASAAERAKLRSLMRAVRTQAREKNK